MYIWKNEEKDFVKESRYGLRPVKKPSELLTYWGFGVCYIHHITTSAHIYNSLVAFSDGFPIDKRRMSHQWIWNDGIHDLDAIIFVSDMQRKLKHWGILELQ